MENKSRIEKKGRVISSKEYLCNVMLPQGTDSYTVIGHCQIMDKVEEQLKKIGLEIEYEDYIHSHDGEVATGSCFIKNQSDDEIGMVFKWWNSYNKVMRFRVAIGGFILKNNTYMIGSQGMEWMRKHTGTADQESDNVIEQLLQGATQYFREIIQEKNLMKSYPLTLESFGHIMGSLFFEHNLVLPTHSNFIKNKWHQAIKDEVPYTNLWDLYCLIMESIHELDVSKWITSQQKIHHAIMTEYALLQVKSAEEDEVINFETETVKDIELPTLIEIVEKEEHIIPTAPIVIETPVPVEDDQRRFKNMAVQLGYDEKTINNFLEKGYDNSAEVSMNIKMFRSLPKETIKQSPKEILLSMGAIDSPLLSYFTDNKFNKFISNEENLEAWYKYSNHMMPSAPKENIILCSQDEFIKHIDTNYGIDPLTVKEYAGEMMDCTLSLEDNVIEFLDFIKRNSNIEDELLKSVEIEGIDDFTSLSEELSELSDMEEVKQVKDFVFPTDLDTISEVKPVKNLTKHVPIIPPKVEPIITDYQDVLDIDDNLILEEEVPEGIIRINEKMLSLYGEVKPCTYKITDKQINVSIDSTLEVFYLSL